MEGALVGSELDIDSTPHLDEVQMQHAQALIVLTRYIWKDHEDVLDVLMREDLDEDQQSQMIYDILCDWSYAALSGSSNPLSVQAATVLDMDEQALLGFVFSLSDVQSYVCAEMYEPQPDNEFFWVYTPPSSDSEVDSDGLDIQLDPAPPKMVRVSKKPRTPKQVDEYTQSIKARLKAFKNVFQRFKQLIRIARKGSDQKSAKAFFDMMNLVKRLGAHLYDVQSILSEPALSERPELHAQVQATLHAYEVYRFNIAWLQSQEWSAFGFQVVPQMAELLPVNVSLYGGEVS